MISVQFKKKKTPAAKDKVAIRCGERVRVLEAWNHGIVPHEMVHVVVEEVFPLRGFVRLMAEGYAPEQIEGRAAPAEALQAEGLVGAFQYELWGISDPTAFEEILHDAHDQPGFPPPPPVRREQLEAGRRRLRELGAQWEALPPGASLELTLSELPIAS